MMRTMKTIKILHTIPAATVMLLALAACSQDEADTMPDGRYALEIASATISGSATRVTESADRKSSTWQTGDIIYVKTSGTATAGTFQRTSSGTFQAVQPIYWTKTTENVDAWLPANGTVSLANQSSKLAYVLKASAANATCKQPVSLTFSHQLAKVRIVAQGTDASMLTTVKLKSYTSCTAAQGTVSNGSSDGWITMMQTTYSGTKCWEASVVPGKEIKEVDLYGIPLQLSTPVTPEAGKVSTITLTVGL